MPQNTITGQSKAMPRFYILVMVLLGVTGFGQMPIYGRYYLSDIPGMTWMGDFYATHTLHYIGAALLLFIIAYKLTEYALSSRKTYTLTKSGWARAVLMAGIAVTGIFRVLKNMPDILFSPNFTMFIDFAHLGFVMIFLFASLGFVVTKAPWRLPKRP